MEKYNDLLNKISELKVAELAELVKAMETKFGISAAVAAAPAGGAGAGAEAEEKTAWDVVLKDAGAQKIQVIKVIREATGLGLKEAKDITDTTPKTVKAAMKKEDAENLKKLLETAGAKVELK